MHLYIDERETSLHEKVMALNPTFQVTKKVLHLGDMVLEYPDNSVAFIVERKTIADLLASIRDGRYEEQSHRLIHSSGVPTHNILYLIEGIMNQVNIPQNRTLVYSTMISLNHYKGFSVFRTSSIHETAEWLVATVNKVLANHTKKKLPCFRQPSAPASASLVEAPLLPPPPAYCSVVKRVKKDNITPQNIGEILLCQIPNISTVSAVAIMQKFGSIQQLIHAMETDPHCLDNMTTESSSGVRKMSSAVIANLRHYLLESTVPVKPP